jgi:hypothetical protein
VKLLFVSRLWRGLHHKSPSLKCDASNTVAFILFL